MAGPESVVWLHNARQLSAAVCFVEVLQLHMSFSELKTKCPHYNSRQGMAPARLQCMEISYVLEIVCRSPRRVGRSEK